MKGKVKEKWGELTDDDLAVVEGNKDKLVGLIQDRYGKVKEEAEKEVEEWRKSLQIGADSCWAERINTKGNDHALG